MNSNGDPRGSQQQQQQQQQQPAQGPTTQPHPHHHQHHHHYHHRDNHPATSSVMTTTMTTNRSLTRALVMNESSGVPFGHVPAYLPGSSSLVEELDKRVLIVLRDGKHLIGVRMIVALIYIYSYVCYGGYA
jgi:hypothetical protein